jgi:hypothetical protein
MSRMSCSVGIIPASEFFVALTNTMTRIVLLLSIRGTTGRRTPWGFQAGVE